jgi:hypothetical protein
MRSSASLAMPEPWGVSKLTSSHLTQSQLRIGIDGLLENQLGAHSIIMERMNAKIWKNDCVRDGGTVRI